MKQFINPSTLETDMKRLGAYIREAMEKGKPLEITIKQARRVKTTAQIAYFHHLIGLVDKETGQGKDSLKRLLKIKLGYYIEYWAEGRAEKDLKSLSGASIEEMGIFIESAQTLCINLNIKFMQPDEFYKSIGYSK